MSELTANVNWLATIIGAVLAFVLGWLWYSPMLFGRKWAEGVGVKLGDAQASPAAALVLQAVGTFLLAWLVGITAAGNALATIVLVIVTIMVLQAAGGQFTRKSRAAILIEVAFTAAMAVIMILVQAIL